MNFELPGRRNPPKVELSITLEKTSEGWTVRCGDHSADMLCTDEALGTIASMMYAGKPGYLRNPVQNYIWDTYYRSEIFQRLLPESIDRA